MAKFRTKYLTNCHAYEFLASQESFLEFYLVYKNVCLKVLQEKLIWICKWLTEHFSKINFQFCVQILYRKSSNWIKFCQKFHSLTFVIFVPKISNKQFRKLDKVLRNFPSWHFFVFVTVFKKFRFEICNLRNWSCNKSERYCTTS